MKIKYSQFANIILYFIMIFFIIDIGNLKYIIAFLGIFSFLLLNYFKNKCIIFKNFNYEVKWLAFILLTFISITVFKQIINGFNLYFINEIIYFITPILLVYSFLQLQDKNSIFQTIDWLFIIYCITFFVKTWGQLNLDQIIQISFADTYSPFEGTGLAFVFVPFIFYFYYRKNLLLEVICFIFVFLTMKRLAFVAGIVVLIVSLITLNKNTSKIKVKKIWAIIPCIFFILLPIITNLLLNDAFADWFADKTGLDIYSFTMGRFLRLNQVTDNNAGGYGWGSTTTYLTDYYTNYFANTDSTNFNLHNDIYKIFIEIGIIGSCVFTIGFFKLCKRNYMAVLFVTYLFFEMFVNHLLGAGSVQFWVLSYLLLFCFNCKVFNRIENRSLLVKNVR